MCNHCTIILQNGDMSPRMWRCPETGKINCFSQIRDIAYSYSSFLNKTQEECLQIAFDLLKYKQEEKLKESHSPYYCEDYFAKDLAAHFHQLVMDMKNSKRKEEFEKEKEELVFPKDNLQKFQPNPVIVIFYIFVVCFIISIATLVGYVVSSITK